MVLKVWHWLFWLLWNQFFSFQLKVIDIDENGSLNALKLSKSTTKMVMVGGRQFFEKNFLQHWKHISHSVGIHINKQNYHIWGSKNPQAIEERPLHIEKVTVWCALWSEVVIGPYFSENNYETTVTVNSKRYGHMITDFFCLLLKSTTWRIWWFQQDGATCHTTRANITLFQETFLTILK